MKIEGPSKTQKTGKSDKAKKANKADGSFGEMVTGAARESAAAAASQSIAKVDALLAVQGAESATEKTARRKMRERGDKVLKQLDLLRMGLLTGNLTLGQVIDVADVVASHREKISDPQMTAVLDEIDMRAQIEIAKARKAMESKI
tara:strand:+ start:110 stop:547 length:438 start_codon:yes stop_codon:yes gene_type:complete